MRQIKLGLFSLPAATISPPGVILILIPSDSISNQYVTFVQTAERACFDMVFVAGDVFR